MPIRNESTRSAYDADAAVRAITDTITGPLYSFVEYDTDGFRPLYIDDRTIELYDDREEMAEHFQRIHTNVHMDFMEITLFKNTLFPVADRVEYMVTAMDFLKIVRIYVGDDGLFLAVDPDEPVGPIVDAVKSVAGSALKGNS